MRKIFVLLSLVASLLSAADNDLYDNSISVNIGYGTMSASAATYGGANYGLQFNRNIHYGGNAWSIDALQFAVDYARLNNEARDYSIRIGSNALLYIETENNWTPFLKAGAGIQFIGGTEKISAGNYFFGTLGAGLEYQLRGDTSLIGEFTDHITFAGENNMRLALGIKYSFGQSY